MEKLYIIYDTTEERNIFPEIQRLVGTRKIKYYNVYCTIIIVHRKWV